MLSHNFSIFLFIFVHKTHAYSYSTKQSDSYVAGVVEFTPESLFVNWELRTEIHLAEYETIITSNEARIVDIIVFPELTLNNVAFPIEVPKPEENVIACDDNQWDVVLRNLSCAAIQSRKYVVVNLSEQSRCTVESQAAINDTRPCSSKEFNLYNTNVAFDRNGKIVARYRKFNLFREAGTNITLTAELSTFDTDFGVTFGMFTCFDILFYEPVMHLIKKGINDFVYPAMWTSELPFLTAVQVYESWAFGNNVNLLAAGTNMAQSGSSGSGIFSGEHGALTSILSSEPQRKLLIATVPKVPSSVEKITKNIVTSTPRNFENFYLGRDFLEEFRTVSIDQTQQADNFMMCHNQFCCRFNAEFDHLTVDDDKEGYHYRYAVFDGQRTFQGYANQNVSICGIMTCLNSTIESCGRLITNITTHTNSVRFRKLQISGTFNGLDSLSLPNSLTTSFLPVPPDETIFLDAVISTSPNAIEKAILFILDKPREDLLAFGIYSINYIDKIADDTDKGDDGGGVARIMIPIPTLILSMVLAKLLG